MRCLATYRLALPLLLVLTALSPVEAGVAVNLMLPATAPQKTYHGLTLSIDSDWVQNYGHRPVRVTVKSTKRANQDIPLRLELSLGDWSNVNYVTTGVDLVLPAGSTSASQTVLLPQSTNTQYLNVTTLIDGRKIDELSLEMHSVGTGQYWGGDSSVPRILFVDSKPPDVTKFAFLGRPPYLSYGNSISYTQIQDIFAFIHLRPDQLSEQWLTYDALDWLFLSVDEARQLAKKQPKKWQAIENWTRCGGTLCLYGAGQDWSRLSDVEQLLHVAASPQDAGEPHRGWESPTMVDFETNVVPAIEDAWQIQANQAAEDGSVAAPGPKPVPPKAPDKPPFLWKSVAFGTVVAFGTDQPFPGEEETWRWLVSSLEPRSNQWTARFGAVPDGENPHFNEFLIGEVGLPPIRTYRVLITVFVVVIGPLNYWLLRRAGRLHLFLFTVPLAALITGLGLLSYALMSDGLVSRVRIRSLTHLDQQNGLAASTARLSYYVGLAPSDGMTFSEDTLVIPFGLEAFQHGNRRRRELTWNGQQHLTRGWLVSRTPAQFVTARCQRSKAGLDLTTSEGKLAVKNRLGTRIVQLLMCDESGLWHHGAGIAADESARLVSAPRDDERDEAAKRLLAALRANPLQLPDTMSALGANQNWLLFSPRYYYYENASIDASESQLEDSLSTLQANLRTHRLPPRSYVAVVEHPPEIETGLPELVETQSLHVIHGTW